MKWSRLSAIAARIYSRCVCICVAFAPRQHEKGLRLGHRSPTLLKKEMSGCVPTSGPLRYPFLDLFGQPRDAALAELYPLGKRSGVFQSSDVNEAVRDAIDGL